VAICRVVDHAMLAQQDGGPLAPLYTAYLKDNGFL
jgi:hypothetical protein